MTQEQELYEASFSFTQEANCLNMESEEITIKCRSSLGIDADKGCFYEIKTEGWSIDNIGELQALFDRIHKSLFPEQLKQRQ